jgi:hypothetical protein
MLPAAAVGVYPAHAQWYGYDVYCARCGFVSTWIIKAGADSAAEKHRQGHS